MDPFEKGLRSEIPLDVAAEFFIKLKYGSAGPDGQKIAEMKSKLKAASGGFLPPTAQGQNMPAATAAAPAPLPGPAQGQHKMAGKYLNATKKVLKDNPVASHVGGMAAAFSAGAATERRIGSKYDDKGKKKSKHAEAFRKAASSMFGEGMVAAGTVAPKVDMNQYMAMEQMGEDAESSNQAEFLRQKLQDAQAELQAAQDQAAMAQQQAQQLQATQSQHEQQLTAAQQQSQLATQAAMQNVQQAHDLAMKATSQALQAKDDAINTHSLAAQMRMSYQDLRGNIMDAVAQDNAAPVGEAIKAQGALGSQPAAPMGGGPMAAGGDPMADPNADPAADPAAGGPPGAAEDPAAAPPGGAAPPEAAPPAAEPAEEEAPAEPKAPPAEPKTAGIGRDLLGAGLQHLKSRAPYAAAGAVLGGAMGGAESQMDHSGMRQQVQDMEQQGAGGFGKALRLAAAKAQLAIGEAAEKHPMAATATGAMMGAGAGMSMGPGIRDGFAKLPDSIRQLRGKG